jgi:hypothetical protein
MAATRQGGRFFLSDILGPHRIVFRPAQRPNRRFFDPANRHLDPPLPDATKRRPDGPMGVHGSHGPMSRGAVAYSSTKGARGKYPVWVIVLAPPSSG